MNLAECTEAQYELIENILDICEDLDGVVLRVEWLGHSYERDCTWIHISGLYADVRNTVETFLCFVTSKRKLIERAI